MVLEDFFDVEKTDYYSFFKNKYIPSVKKYIEENPDLEFEDREVERVTLQAESFKKHIPKIIPTLKSKFGNYTIVDTEKKIYRDLEQETDEYIFCFNGYIDLTLKDEEGQHHIIDWKTCMRIWNKWRRKDASYYNQLLLYKNFFCEEMELDHDDVDVHYFFIPTEEEADIELWSPTFSEKDMKSALKSLNEMIQNAFGLKNYMKKATCKFCDCKKYYDKLKE